MERRLFPRKTVDLPIICKSGGWPGNRSSGRVIDISMGGVGVIINKPLKECRTVVVTIYDHSSGLKIQAEGEIAWYRTLESGKVRLGIDFQKIAWTKLKDLIDQR